jgi:hypothetical protein
LKNYDEKGLKKRRNDSKKLFETDFSKSRCHEKCEIKFRKGPHKLRRYLCGLYLGRVGRLFVQLIIQLVTTSAPPPPFDFFLFLVQDYSELSYWSKLYLFNFSVTYVQILKTKFLVALGKSLVLISLKILLKKNEILNDKSHPQKQSEQLSCDQIQKPVISPV